MQQPSNAEPVGTTGVDGDGPLPPTSAFDAELDDIGIPEPRFSSDQLALIDEAKQSIQCCGYKCGKIKLRFAPRSIELIPYDALVDDTMSPESFAAISIIIWVPEVTVVCVCMHVDCSVCVHEYRLLSVCTNIDCCLCVPMMIAVDCYLCVQ